MLILLLKHIVILLLIPLLFQYKKEVLYRKFSLFYKTFQVLIFSLYIQITAYSAKLLTHNEKDEENRKKTPLAEHKNVARGVFDNQGI